MEIEFTIDDSIREDKIICLNTSQDMDNETIYYSFNSDQTIYSDQNSDIEDYIKSLNQDDCDDSLDLSIQDSNQFSLDTFQKQLYQHQLDALTALQTHNKGIIASFCGTGKSRIITEYIRTLIYNFQNTQFEETKDQNTNINYDSIHILITFPSLLLIEQFQDRYVGELNINTYIISSESSYKISEEQFQSRISLTLITYQSLKKIESFQDYFNIVIFDEAHHICTKARLNLIQKFNSKMFYFTATPKYTKQLDMYINQLDNDSDNYDSDSDNFDNKFTTGGIIYEYNFTNALTDQIVADYQLIFRIYQNAQQGLLKELNMLNQIVNLAKQEQRKRIIIFTRYIHTNNNNKTSCQNFESLDCGIQTISSSITVEERTRIFEWFKDSDDQIKILCNVSCIKEGVDLPCTDMIVFTEDKQSKIDIIQAIGRGTRKFNEKRDCILLTLTEYQTNINELTNSNHVNTQNKFKTIQYICKALKTIDLRIEQVIKGNPSSLKFTIQSDIINNDNINHQSAINSIQKHLFQSLDKDYIWDDKLQKCIQFKQQNNKYPSQSSKELQEKHLGNWLNDQKRALKGKGDRKMTEQRRKLLEEYLKDFKTTDEIWDENLQLCIQFKQQNNKYPSQSSKDQQEKYLGNWLSGQKRALNGKGYITEQRRKLLEEYLKVFKTNDEIWDEKLQLCIQFKQQNNQYPSESSKDQQEKYLGNWLSGQRAALNGKGDRKMTEERRKLLEDYLKDFKTDDQIWNQNLQLCIQFKQQNNKYPSKASKDQQVKKLGQWLSHQRRALNGKGRCKMTEQRRKLLEDYLKQ